jgi:nucleotide-binding universal stress UspA family protein
MRNDGPILVPLDGSELAEGALPYASALAAATGADLLLLSAWDGAERGLAETFPSMAVDIEAAAKQHYMQYLDGARARIAPGAETLCQQGEPGDTILAVAAERGARAIAIGTHGRSGIGRWLAGSTASHVLRHSTVPLLAVGPHALEHPKSSVAYKHILAPLDGSALSETALPVATKLASDAGAKISLVRVVPFAARTYPYTMPEAYLPQIDQEVEKGAEEYLQRQKSSLSGTPVEAYALRGPIAESLIDFVDKESVDLVVMTTHARGGLSRAALGSVADRMLQGSAPVLLLRPAE